ncbi:hypothetical protein B0T22DRAFT_312433 [Podospora appendiculata]|uniref:Cupin type-2 domain-containing protein n=1 Tax=Podospora appendiculata TaxID=314037 RepID=A0AAE0WYW0_9PEZI|nr:hypothetical protein B0T22DRAFT_312433 [Podospora appendiculata]
MPKMATTSIISRPPPTAVIYDLTTANKATITLPRGSAWTSGLHWHETHTEYLRVVSGTIRVRLGDETFDVSAGPSSAELRIDRYTWHEWARASVAGDEHVVVVERTEPADGEKAVFFRELNGVILGAAAAAAAGRAWVPSWVVGAWVQWRLMVVFYRRDNFPVMLGVRELARRWGVTAVGSVGDCLLWWVEVWWSRLVLRVAAVVAWVVFT